MTRAGRAVGRRGVLAAALGASGALAWSALPLSRVNVARACGGFFAQEVERLPSLSQENVLLLFDAESHTEHFIREVAFRDAGKPFGFVVPTPSEPQVVEVPTSPFPKLRDVFPFQLEADAWGVGLGGIGSGAGVTVKQTSKIGSFTAFVLAATDDKALAGWLKEHGLSTTPESERWLAHYVRLKFHFVAMRFDPPVGAPSGAVEAETFRISFKTPLPFYPYLEPARAPAKRSRRGRSLDLWLVARRPYAPVALRDADSPVWVQPMRAGLSFRDARKKLEQALYDEVEKLLPQGELLVTRFADEKTDRSGFGDVLFAPTEPVTFSREELDMLEPLLGLFDKELLP